MVKHKKRKSYRSNDCLSPLYLCNRENRNCIGRCGDLCFLTTDEEYSLLGKICVNKLVSKAVGYNFALKMSKVLIHLRTFFSI